MRGIQLALTPAGCRPCSLARRASSRERVVEGADVLGRLADDLVTGRTRPSTPMSRSAWSRRGSVGEPRSNPWIRLARAWERLAHSHGRVTIAEPADDAGGRGATSRSGSPPSSGRGPRSWPGSCASGGHARWCAAAHTRRAWRGAATPTRPHLVGMAITTGTTPGRWAARTTSHSFKTGLVRQGHPERMDTTPQQSRTDHNVWAAIFADDPLALRAWLVGIGFEEASSCPTKTGWSIHHSELFWLQGGRVMVSTRDTKEQEGGCRPGLALRRDRGSRGRPRARGMLRAPRSPVPSRTNPIMSQGIQLH